MPIKFAKRHKMEVRNNRIGKTIVWGVLYTLLSLAALLTGIAGLVSKNLIPLSSLTVLSKVVLGLSLGFGAFLTSKKARHRRPRYF